MTETAYFFSIRPQVSYLMKNIQNVTNKNTLNNCIITVWDEAGHFELIVQSTTFLKIAYNINFIIQLNKYLEVHLSQTKRLNNMVVHILTQYITEIEIKRSWNVIIYDGKSFSNVHYN